MSKRKHLWVDEGQVARLRRRLADGDPVVSALAALAHAAARSPRPSAPGEPPLLNATACTVTHLLTGDPAAAARAADAILSAVRLDEGNLGRGFVALHGAVVHDGCYQALDPDRATALNRALFSLARSFRTVDMAHGDPHTITNNHWAVSHAAAALAAMAVDGLPADRQGTLLDAREEVDWARGRLRPFLMHHGDRGLYHEGLGYQMYPAAYWLPLLVASPRYDGVDLLADFPSLRHAGSSLMASVAARPAPGGRCGVKLVWNDDEAPWCNSNVPVLMTHLAPPDQMGGLRWMFDRLNGLQGDGRFGPDYAGWFFALLFYPYDTPPRDPNGVLPRHLTDSRQGLSLLRNRYRDGDDAILGCYARVTHVGGHAQDDAGSIRFMALGHDWIVGGGQDRGEAEWQSIVVPADGSRAKQPLGCGAVIWDEPTGSGGVFGMDLRRPSVAYAERWLAADFSGASGAEGVLTLLDLVDDHQGRAWLWNLSFEPSLACALHADNTGFDLRAGDGASLSARFLAAKPESLAVRRMPDAQRTFQSGTVRDYPGGPYLQARFPACPHLAIYVVMAVGRPAPTTLASTGGLGVRIGPWAWPRPFGAAIPASYRPGESGTLCRFPDGQGP